jgi:endonuclease/exonuclease/phosphatase family metal-dependent hydrolase
MSNNYAGMRRRFGDDAEGLRRCAGRLIALRAALSAARDKRRDDDSLLLATWNIRDFDSNKFGFGPRKLESMYYLAEVIGSFDLVAIQEIGRDLEPLLQLMDILGESWDYIVTDANEGRSGNGERMGFLYHRSAVYFRKIAGEVVLPQGQTIVGSDAGAGTEGGDTKGGGQFARTPFLVAFGSGWFRFSLCTVHIYYGAESGAGLRRRINEIRELVAFFARRQDSEVRERRRRVRQAGGKPAPAQSENYILLGDFNVVSPEHETMRALQEHGFTVPDAIDRDKIIATDPGSALAHRPHFYDQIAVRVTDPRFQVLGGGMIDVFDYVYRDDDINCYTADLDQARARVAKTKGSDSDGEPLSNAADGDPLAFYRRWRTWQMSDHLPLWVEIKTDFTDDYLTGLAT